MNGLAVIPVVVLLLLAACAAHPPAAAPGARADALHDCRVVYDAGSSGTRLYVYEWRDGDWLEHEGPKVSALADPVREIRGRTHADIDAVAAEVVSALERLRADGPADDHGRRAWAGFDWPARCHVLSAAVYATAGMRLAEQEDREQSRALWSSLHAKLRAQVGAGVPVATRTLTGYEEGLYAWLAVRHERQRDDFGIAEIGGASAQVAFPCVRCGEDDDAVRTVLVGGVPRRFYSYSFLGLGGDEAPRALGMPAACAYGIGAAQPGWKKNQCADRIPVAGEHGMRDPYNYAGGQRGTFRDIPAALADASTWFLTGAFNYFDEGLIDSCCVDRGQCFNPATSCFRNVYFDKFLQVLAIPPASPRSDTHWTQGAVLCAREDCLRAAKPLACNWSAAGCLSSGDDR